MSADGYFRLPRKLLRSSLAPEKVAALAWVVSEASYAEREVNGVQLRLGETPPLPLSAFEIRFRWSRKAARLFLEYVLSPECAEQTGVRVKVGKRVQGHDKGHSKGHAWGHTYLVGLVKDTASEGHDKGHSKGHAWGHNVQKTDQDTGNNSPLRGESREGNSEKNGTAPRKRAVPRPLPDDWQPNVKHWTACEDSGIDCAALAEDFVFYWRSTKGTKADWDMTFTKRIAAVRSTGKFRLNGKPVATGVTNAAPSDVADSILARMRS